jgi:glycosyltransferase involved in cell wall biosynthesis
VTGDPTAQKDFESARRHFLFFSGPGNVHKGLDLLLEAFQGTELQLHVCQAIEPAFARAFRVELRAPNVHLHGVVPMRSSRFLGLARRCDWVILPTCAEGQPGSVIECMAHGLIPILSSAANIDVGNLGVVIPLDARAIRGTCEAASAAPIAEVKDRAVATVRTIRKQYSDASFREAFSRTVQNVLHGSA